MAMQDLPRQLKHDAIVEALLELRFDTAEVPEITVGRLMDHELWRDFARTRTVISDIPAALRQGDENLRHQATVELKEPNGHRIVKIGSNVISFHNVRQYIGWNYGFFGQLKTTIEHLFERVDHVSVNCIGLRYLNALTHDKHMISGIDDLKLIVRVNDKSVAGDCNINYRTQDDDFIILTRVATPSFVTGRLPDDTSAYVDVDVFTPRGFSATSSGSVCDWVDAAHIREKVAFFSLLPSEVVNALKKE